MLGSDAYLQACVKVLRENTTLFPDADLGVASCAITEDDRPHPYAGTIFLGLYKGPLSNNFQYGAHFLHEMTSIVVAITMRVSNIPADRRGHYTISKTRADYPTAGLSIDQIAEQVISTISGQPAVINEGNTFLDADEGASGSLSYPLLTPLTYQTTSSGGPKVVGPSHFRSGNAIGSESRGSDDTGLLLKLTFTGGERFTRLLAEPS